jgi:hypothetical protein
VKAAFPRQAAAELLRSESTFGSVILAILLDKYGDEVLEKDVLEIYADVREDFDAIIPEEGENRLNAILISMTTDGFYRNPDIFRAVCTCLYDGDLGDLVSGAVEDMTIPELLWAVYEVGLLHPDGMEFSAGVRAVIDREVSQEAGEEGLSEEEVLPYFQRFVEESKRDLAIQLGILGIDVGDLGEML